MHQINSSKHYINLINNSFLNNVNQHHFSDLHFEQWILLYHHLIKENLNKKPVIMVFEDEKSVETAHNFLNYHFKTEIYPDIELNPYSDIYQSESLLLKRLKIFSDLYENKKFIILCTIKALFLKQTTASFFHNKFSLKENDICGPDKLRKLLVDLGYKFSSTCDEPGTFCSKGEIFDVYNYEGAFRIYYFDELIEKINPIDISTNRSIVSEKVDTLEFLPFPLTLTDEKYRNQLGKALKQFGPNNKELFLKRRNIISSLVNNNLFENYPSYLPLFFNNSDSLFLIAGRNNYLSLSINLKINSNWIDSYQEITSRYYSPENSILPGVDYYYDTFDLEKINIFFKYNISNIEANKNSISNNDSIKLFDTYLAGFDNYTNIIHDHYTKTKFILKTILNLCSEKFIVKFFIKLSDSEDRIKSLLETDSNNFTLLKENINFIHGELSEAFIDYTSNCLYIGEAQIFSTKTKKARVVKSNNFDLFAEQFSTLQGGDFVIHKEFGLGVFDGLINLNLNNIDSDYICIKYRDDDKIYVPVYRMDLVQKYSEADSNLSLADLKTKKFANTKSKSKSAIRTLAFDLIKLQALRETQQGFAFSEPNEIYFDFENSFPFEETPDQKLAIQDVIDDMTKIKPMDRLVCGDVGFGKTEVAMRAAFKAVLDKKQVAILVPTTVLCLQHYNSFLSRFKDFAVNIQQFSRLTPPKDLKDILERIENGKIDIIIGTHKLLSSTVKYYDLGLVIIDEEHRFGVGHKEKLKLLKANLDFMTLSATPIPRTLQMSFLGIRDFSIIKSAPPRRKSIKSSLILDDPALIKDCIEFELSRGGQVFIVHNRVFDIEEYALSIKQLVPHASITIAHGQMNEKELEKKINGFYNGTFNILISTTIIESGIDIPNANTIIINRSNTFGLAQLHQLRGRIGRSDKKGYAYFVIPKNFNQNSLAFKRLEVLKKYSDIGTGFSLATSDLEIRGAGDILGGEQSGHISDIGLELYLQFLREAIAEIKKQPMTNIIDVEVQTKHPAFIPKKYISDSSIRLKYYKKLSNAASEEYLTEISQELFDIFGVFPKELDNLFIILKMRLALKQFAVKTVKLVFKKLELHFIKSILDENELLRNKIVNYFLSRKKIYQLKPDYSVIINLEQELDLNNLFQFVLKITKELVASE